MTTFSIAAIDELWLRGTLVERRLTYGRAEERGNEIVATDARDDALVAECERAILRMHDVMPRDARVRLVARSDGEATMTVEIDGVSIVTTPEFVANDVQLLRHPPVPRPLTPVPLVWHHGSAAVLLHEAIGHPRELGVPEIEWPSWLRVDCPMAMRRASFSDVPLRRMTRVVVSQENAPFALPSPRIDVHLVRGGAYDPLTDVVTIDVAVPRFTIRATRAEIAASLLGATGEAIRYPGVVCSREGQELVVGSYAPVMVTRSAGVLAGRPGGVSPPGEAGCLTASRRDDGAPRYRKWGRTVRWENGTLVRVEEAGEAREENGVFLAAPIAEREQLPELETEWVVETARAVGEAERVLITEGVALHECAGVRWQEHIRRIHVALTRAPWRVLVDDADVATVANALQRCEGEKDFEHLLVPPHIRIDVNCAKEQLPGGLDGYGRPIEHRRVEGEPPNFYRPSYRVRPRRQWMNVRAIPFGTMREAPRVLALVDGGKALIDDGGRIFVTPLRVGRVTAAAESGEMLL